MKRSTPATLALCCLAAMASSAWAEEPTTQPLPPAPPAVVVEKARPESVVGPPADCGISTCCPPCCVPCFPGPDRPWDVPPRRLFPEVGGIRLYGWLDGGYLANPDAPSSRFNGPFNAVDTDEPQFNQGYLVLERRLADNGDLDLGGRVDLLYGTDFFLAQSLGFELHRDGSDRWNGQYYGLALPQMYGEFGTRDLSLKVGHFYSIVGYEFIPAVANFFYSHSYTYQFAQPYTFWGGLATWKPNNQWALQFGLNNGWNAIDRVENRVGVQAGATYTAPSRFWSLGAAVQTGDESVAVGVPTDSVENRTVYDLLLSLQLTRRLSCVTLWEMGSQEGGSPGRDTALWYGLTEYVYYNLSDTLLGGFRFEWFRDEDGTRVGLNRPANPNKPPFPGSFYEITLGLNWIPTNNLRVRPELRWDWFDGKGHPFDDGNSKNQFLVGLDAILQF